MELLKSNIVIDEKFLPSMEMNHIDYFNRAMVFAQTNYFQELSKLVNTHFRTISPTIFFEEFVWARISPGRNLLEFSEMFPRLSKTLGPYYHIMWDLNKHLDKNEMEEKLVKFMTGKEFDDVHRCSYVVNQGIKLFGWDEYKNNFLSSPEKLLALPGLTLAGSQKLSASIGNKYTANNCPDLYKLSKNFGFTQPDEMIAVIGKNFQLLPRTIGMILWYTTMTFDNSDIVSVD